MKNEEMELQAARQAGMRLTVDGEAKAKAWKRAEERLASAKSEVNSAETDLKNMTNEFGRWLMPPDAKVGEAISVWMGDSLVQAEMTDKNGHGTFRVSLRYRGREWGRR